MPKYIAKPATQSRFIAEPKIPTLISNFQVSRPVQTHSVKAQAAPRAASSATQVNVVKKKGCSCSKYAK
jgi:hypothetical protein